MARAPLVVMWRPTHAGHLRTAAEAIACHAARMPTRSAVVARRAFVPGACPSRRLRAEPGPLTTLERYAGVHLQPAVRRRSDGFLVRLQLRRLARYVYPYQKSYRVGRPTIATNRQFNKPRTDRSGDRRNPPGGRANGRFYWPDKQQLSGKEQIARWP